MSGGGTVHPLAGNQMAAVRPEDSVWLSASAGTGKTHVLTSRVLRLLLQPKVKPSQVLCLTFTKAGAAEMTARIKGTLAEWVRLPAPDLAQRIEAIGAAGSPENVARARTLFPQVLDCPGGGLRIDTIHAFSQWLLAAFPHEADLVPGTRPMEDRERSLLARQVLAELLVEAEREPLGDPQLLDAAADLSLRHGPDAVETFLLRCAAKREAWFGPGGWQEPMRANVLRLLGLPSDADASSIAALCTDQVFDVSSLRRCQETLVPWDTKAGKEGTAAIEDWLYLDPAGRAEAIDDLYFGLFTKTTDAPKQLKNILKRDPDYERFIEAVRESIAAVRDLRVLLDLVERLVPALRLGRAFAIAWEEAKQREGLIDFDDQIRQAAALLKRREMADWIRYKLDRRFDHILVDEAQDTNPAQWDIILDGLAGDFWSGLGQRGDILRTLFVVGDYKQAIFRFQGTSPENFEAARRRVRDAMDLAAANAQDLRVNVRARKLEELGLDRSFRTASNVLQFVDKAIEQIGHEEFGLEKKPEPHSGQDRPGYAALWRPVGAVEEGEEVQEAGESEETWLSEPDRKLAENIAQQVKDWTSPGGTGFTLVKGGKRRATPGDVMILVRKRRDLAGLIVARLHAHGVPVAGVDRLRIAEPLAVRDLMAALRFAAQPLDDLNLACLLVSPLIGWSQEDLLEHGYRNYGVKLWDHLREQQHPVLEQLQQILRRADFGPPQALLHWILAGEWQGRRKLVARLGREANDPIDELVNAAHAYAATGTPSLAGFIAWFDAGEGELKRESDNAGGLVQVMTVHGSKGLQAPIVILADATGKPGGAGRGALDLPDPAAPENRAIPLPPIRLEERAGRLADEFAKAEQADMEEHWRLLYVAMTRAEEALFIGGALGAREKEPHEDSWYARLRSLFGADEWKDDPIWSGRLAWGSEAASVPAKAAEPANDDGVELPAWLDTPPPAEPRPPRPLAPSALGEDEAPDPPYPPGSGAEAARRGTLLHRLLERLPDIAEDRREAAGSAWLERNAPDLPAEMREAMLGDALAVVANPDWAELFAPGSLAEVPIAATVAGQVVAGTIDRLVVGDKTIRLVDFKTSRRPPAALDEVPVAVLRQMAAYAAALEATFPGRAVEAALLYTAAPCLIAIPAERLAMHKPRLPGTE
ncbi:MAG: double-strand break repair helicase AddA [Sphingomonadaceae bacterium]